MEKRDRDDRKMAEFRCEKCGKGSITMHGDAMIFFGGNCHICCKDCGGKLVKVKDERSQTDEHV